MGVKFELEAGESVEHEEKNVMWLKSKFQGYSGRLVVTERRVVFAQTGIPSLGLLGMLFNKQGTVRVQIAKSDLEGAEKGQHGRAKNVLNLKSRGGDEHRFVLNTPYETWEQRITQWRSR
jgi:hypothetical protein